ncbi:MAG: type II toxin-antitoxin system VapC family toxin [Acidimicrobiaceae bacterium]|nr:type II toxin-antitoxin system VapC family toxin [Acidimicrobiaceae bacterium]
MKLVDANVLLYAVNRDAPHHASARDWLDEALSGGARVAFCWVVLLAFLRLSTNERIFDQPLSASDAIAQAEDWLAQPAAVVVEPTARHLGVVQQLLAPLKTGGNLVNDAHLAALAVEHRCTVVSYDTDFLSFDGVKLETPTI